MKNTRWEKRIENECWTSTPDMKLAAKLLARQQAGFVRKIKKLMTQRADEYMADSENTMSNKQLRMVNNGRAWAIKDLRDDLLAALANQRSGKKK